MSELTMFGKRFRIRPGNTAPADEREPEGLPEDTVEGHPAIAPPGSLWAEQDDVDFFVNPALTLDTLTYITPNGEGPEAAFREAFDLPPKPGEDATASSRDQPKN